jgi:release factor glutamine methyltransferase
MLLSVLLHDIQECLRSAGVDTPDHDARMLISESLSVDSSSIRMAEILSLTVDETLGRYAKKDIASNSGLILTSLAQLVRRRAHREPLQHILGHTWFRYIDVQVGKGVFVPRPETEIVVQAGIDFLSSAGISAPKIVDLCAGSGVIGLSLCKELPQAQVWAVEASPDAVVWTARNRDALIERGDISPAQYRLTLADATNDATLRELDDCVDLVISNPPYIPEREIPEQPEVVDWDPDIALYGGSADGLLIPTEIIRRASALLHHGGALVMEHDISQAQALRAQALRQGFNHAHTGTDLNGRPRFLVATL